MQQWTIITIVGAAMPVMERRFAEWSSQRRSSDPSLWSADDWPSRTTSAAQLLMRRLEQHRAVPPVVYYSSHVDLWSSFGELFHFIPLAPPVVAYDAREFWSYRLPDRGQLLRRVRQAKTREPSQECIWLANALELAATAYRKLWRERLVIIERRSLGASPSDQELLDTAATRPGWLRL